MNVRPNQQATALNEFDVMHFSCETDSSGMFWGAGKRTQTWVHVGVTSSLSFSMIHIIGLTSEHIRASCQLEPFKVKSFDFLLCHPVSTIRSQNCRAEHCGSKHFTSRLWAVGSLTPLPRTDISCSADTTSLSKAPRKRHDFVRSTRPLSQ